MSVPVDSQSITATLACSALFCVDTPHSQHPSPVGVTDDSPVYIPLVCPLTGTKIRNPVRAPGSNTYACFDKESFALSGRFTCPLTGVYCLVTELSADPAVASILAATPDDATFALVNPSVILIY